MFKRLKEYVIYKTIGHAENRFSIFVWMRQINDRLHRLEEKQAEEAVQERAECEVRFEAKLQTLQGMIAMLDEKTAYLTDRIEADE